MTLRRRSAGTPRRRGAPVWAVWIAAGAAALGAGMMIAVHGIGQGPSVPPAGAITSSSRVPVARGPAPLALAAEVDTRAPLGRSEPVSLSIPAIGVDTTLMRLGLLADGTLEVPPGGFPAGWYTGAPTPGELGPAVIAGHVDHAGPAVFHDLKRMKKGDRIEVTRADGSLVEFVVTKVGRYAKNRFPTQAVYGPIDHAGLRLITCGGDWDASAGHYKDNVVVFATLVTSTPAPA